MTTISIFPPNRSVVWCLKIPTLLSISVTTAVPDAKAYNSLPISAKNDCEALHNAILGSVGSHFATEGISP
jgi:hypothetical protein